jgi:uncharacterized RDD family membrane protein YckC
MELLRLWKIIMPASLPTLVDRYREYSDEELVDICAAPDGDYVMEAVEAARAELSRRGVSPTRTPRHQPQGEPPDPFRPRPWARYFARQIDSFIVGVPWTLGMVLVGGGHKWLLLVLYVALWLSLEPLLLSLYGTTPGKAAFRLHVEDRDGHVPTYSRALSRTLGLFAAGMGLGLPLLSLLALGVSFDRLRAKGSTHWDDWSGTRVRTGESPEPMAAVA